MCLIEKIVFKCPRCGAIYPNPPKNWLCSKCHSPLIIDKGDIRYKRLLGEGDTPIIRLKEESVYFKLEYMNPTGSFKDRGVSFTIQYLLNKECEYVIEDSSGNTGISTAVYATAVGKKPVIYAPKTISPGKNHC